MSTTTNGPICASCGRAVVEDEEVVVRGPCTNCGSLLRSYSLVVMSVINVSSGIRLKGFRKGMKKFFVDFFRGIELWRDRGTLSYREKMIDREKDYYRESITDLSSGEVIREVREPLSKHIDRGSARFKKNR